MRKDFKNIPLSESSVSLKLSEIRKRCTELADESEWLEDLTLENEVPAVSHDRHDPYNRG